MQDESQVLLNSLGALSKISKCFFLGGVRILIKGIDTICSYLISANKSSAKSSKNLDNSWTAVASDGIIRSNLGQMGSPANLLPHYNSQVCHKEGILVRLRGEKRDVKRGLETM